MKVAYLSPVRIAAWVLLATLCFSSTASAGFTQDYESALNTFRGAKAPADYQKAAKLFTTLADRKDAGDMAGNCLYWQAECWYGLKEYTKALSAFEKVLLLPKSNKEEACRYKVAVCYVRLGMNDSARWELTRFLRDFPSSTLTTSAKRELDRMPAK